MKILFASNLYGENARGGAERVVEREARALARRGSETVVVSAERPREVPKGVCLPAEPWRCPPPGDAESVRRSYGAATRRLAKPGEPRVIRYSPPNLFFYADLHRHRMASRFAWHLVDIANGKSARTFGAIVDLERPDVVHTHNLMGLGFLIPAEIRRRRVRHVHTVHDVQLLHPSGLLPPDGRRSTALAAHVRVMRTVFGSPDVVIFPTRYLMDLYVREGFFPRSRRIVVSNPAPELAPVRALPTRPVFLFVGQLERHKGIHLLLDAWQAAAPAGAALLVVGGGTEDAEVRRRAASLVGVEVLGKLGPDDVSSAYDRATHVVVPSLVIENAPTVILEAHARGVPVIAAATGGIPELAGKDTGGRLFVPGDGAALAAAIRDAARLDGWQGMSVAARAAAAKLGMDAHVVALEAAYAGK